LDISIIIVNYNVEHFLEQCLKSVRTAVQEVDAEVFVVDNISVDGSVAMVKEKFPEVILIENKDNVGFSKANNQAMRIAKGRYVLLLNPDTVVEEDTFVKTIKFMDETPDCGGLGVKMIDGKGVFLPESKRGLPTPSVAFYKIFGFSKIFPKSKRFGKYHLGYLPMDEVNEIEILSGAYMMMRKDALDKVGLLDEDFFMYGEDIDLSYRIVLGGYKNYYFPHTSIIHYKGESTKKSSVNYVFVFYNAMIIFAKKHFSAKNAKTFSFLINIAIYLRAGFAIFSRLLKSLLVPLLDFSLITFSLYLICYYYQLSQDLIFDVDLLQIALPSYALVWVLFTYFFGGYDKPIKLLNALKGVLFGSALLLMIYGLLPKEVQFSRFILIFGSLSTILNVLLVRFLLSLFKVEGYSLEDASKKRFLIIGDDDEKDRVLPLLKQTTTVSFFGQLSPLEYVKNSNIDKGSLSKLSDYIYINKIDEVIFSAKNLSSQRIIELMSNISAAKRVDFKIAQPDSMYLIGSNSIHTSGDLYILDLNTINTIKNRRNKRLFDFVSSLFIFALSPFLLIISGFKFKIFKNIFEVIIGRKTWVGYVKIGADTVVRYPKIKPWVISISERKSEQSEDILHKLNLIYAKDYSVSKDVSKLVRSVSKIWS
jgi:GT2 family glycosyltransferase